MELKDIEFVSRSSITFIYLNNRLDEIKKSVKDLRKKNQINKLSLLFDTNFKADKQNSKQLEKLKKVVYKLQEKTDFLRNSVWVFDAGSKKVEKYNLPNYRKHEEMEHSETGKRKYVLSFFFGFIR